MKTSELMGAALNTAVHNLAFPDEPIQEGCTAPPYSSDWAFGGPLIQRERIDIQPLGNQYQGEQWRACGAFISPTPLIAAMRFYVASVLGDEVEVPDGL